MVKVSESFSFEIPDDWRDDSDAHRLVFHGPGGEEIIVSIAGVEAAASPEERAMISERVLGNALDSLTSTLDGPDLRRTTPALATTVHNKCQFWQGDARSNDGVTFFGGVVACDENAVLMLTFEAPFTEGRASEFGRLIGTIRSA